MEVPQEEQENEINNQQPQNKKKKDLAQSMEKRNFYVMFTIASILFSVILAIINSSHLILFYVFEKQPFFPQGWNPWYSVIYVFAFYMLLYSFVYVYHVKSSQYVESDKGKKTQQKSDKNKNKKKVDQSSLTFIYVGLAIFICCFILHIYTGLFILDYQPPNYISD